MNTSPGPTLPPQRLVYALMGVLIAILLAATGVFLWAGNRVVPGAVTIGGPFTLENGAGARVTAADFRGKYMLVYFGYTYCPDVCPTTLTSVAGALDKLGPEAAKLRPVFITVDPKRDTPAVVQRYAAAFSPAITGLTGTAEEIAQVANEYRVYYAEHRTGPGPDDYAMDHSSVLYLMGPDGAFVAPIRADATADEMAVNLKRFLG